MATNDIRRAVGLFSSRQDAQDAMHRLRDTGFNMDQVSIIAKNEATGTMAGANVANEDKADQIKGGAKTGAVSGAATGGFIGLIGSLGVLAIPGVGVAAEVGILLANTLIGGGLGAAGGGLVGALIGWGVPEDQAKYYNSRVDEYNDYMVVLEGTERDIRNAEATLGNYRIRDWNIFGAPDPVASRRVGTPRAY